MQAHEIFNKGFAEPPCLFRGEIQTARQVSAKNDPVNRLHHVEWRAENGIIIAVKKHFRSRRVDGVQLREYAKFAVHIVGRFYLAAEGRTAKNQLPVTELHRVRQV